MKFHGYAMPTCIWKLVVWYSYIFIYLVYRSFLVSCDFAEPWNNAGSPVSYCPIIWAYHYYFHLLGLLWGFSEIPYIRCCAWHLSDLHLAFSFLCYHEPILNMGTFWGLLDSLAPIGQSLGQCMGGGKAVSLRGRVRRHERSPSSTVSLIIDPARRILCFKNAIQK